MLEQAQETTKRDPQQLGAVWRDYKQANPDVRIRDAASALSVSEAELVATSVGAAATRLRTDWREIVEAMPALGKIMCLTRNEHCVHEKTGTFGSIQINAHGGVVLDPDIDLRLFFGRWHHGFAVEEAVESGPRRSLQFFDVDGTAVHKIYLKPESDAAAYGATLVDGFTIVFRAHQDSVGSDTLKVSGATAAKQMQTQGGVAIAASDLISGGIYAATYILAADRFRLHSVGPRVQPSPGSVESTSPMCRLDFVSSTTIRLSRFGGRQIPIPAGGVPILRTIPDAGVDLASTGINAGFYYVYAFWNGSAVALEASATGWSRDTNTGLPIKTGDQTRLLVGAVSLPSNTTFRDDATYRGVSSYWNRRARFVSATLGSNQATASTSMTFFAGDLTFAAVTWADTVVDLAAHIQFQHSASGGRSNAQFFDGGTAAGPISGQQAALLSDPFSHAIPKVAYLPAEGLRNWQLRGSTPSGTVTWISAQTAIYAIVWG